MKKGNVFYLKQKAILVFIFFIFCSSLAAKKISNETSIKIFNETDISTSFSYLGRLPLNPDLLKKNFENKTLSVQYYDAQGEIYTEVTDVLAFLAVLSTMFITDEQRMEYWKNKNNFQNPMPPMPKELNRIFIP